ncbi:ArsR/SmtB family transcription factor [Streptomyces sp. UC4497]
MRAENPSAQAAQAVIAPWQPGMMNDRAAAIDLSDRDQRLRHTAAAPGEREDYWNTAFADEWERIEPSLYESIARAGSQIAHQGVFPMLRTLVPQIRIDPTLRTLRLDRPHHHDIAVTRESPITFTASHYVWPHVRITCDTPWPQRVTFPALPLTPAAATRPTSQEDTLTALRALAAAPRLQLITHLAGQSRSTQELATLLGLSTSVTSRHLHQLTQEGLTTTRREGYYVLYSLDPTHLGEIATALTTLAHRAAPPGMGAGLSASATAAFQLNSLLSLK